MKMKIALHFGEKFFIYYEMVLRVFINNTESIDGVL